MPIPVGIVRGRIGSFDSIAADHPTDTCLQETAAGHTPQARVGPTRPTAGHIVGYRVSPPPDAGSAMVRHFHHSVVRCGPVCLGIGRPNEPKDTAPATG
jgi:hypothetical protein